VGVLQGGDTNNGLYSKTCWNTTDLIYQLNSPLEEIIKKISTKDSYMKKKKTRPYNESQCGSVLVQTPLTFTVKGDNLLTPMSSKISMSFFLQSKRN